MSNPKFTENKNLISVTLHSEADTKELAAQLAKLPLVGSVWLAGDLGAGKTTLTLHAIAEIQKKGGTAAFIDAEHALDPEYAREVPSWYVSSDAWLALSSDSRRMRRVPFSRW